MTTPTPQNYLLLDKDDTLGNFPHPGFFPDVIHFLKQQHQLDRKLVIATYAPVKHTAENLLPLADILHASICREHFRCQDKQGTNIKDFYINVSGEIIETIKTDKPHILYENPYAPHYVFKDLHLARRYLDPKNYNHLRTVMIGDSNDEYAAVSDPFTPLIIISDRQRDGEWQPVSALIDYLFQDPQQEPWKIFDELYDQMQDNPFIQQQFSCTLEKDRYLGRTITMHP